VFIKAEDGQRKWSKKEEEKSGMPDMKSAASTQILINVDFCGGHCEE
jgi:hypothetical protein